MPKNEKFPGHDRKQEKVNQIDISTKGSCYQWTMLLNHSRDLEITLKIWKQTVSWRKFTDANLQ